jgi:hypothetical protein
VEIFEPNPRIPYDGTNRVKIGPREGENKPDSPATKIILGVMFWA